MTTESTAGWETYTDAVTWENMPKDGGHFLYVDGDFTAPAAAHTAYPNAYTIAIEPTTPADEYDVEKGNPDHPVTWAVMMRQKHDYVGRIYCNLATVPVVLDQFTTAGLKPPTFRIADWTDSAPASVPVYGAGTDGVQYASGSKYDTSLMRPGVPRYNQTAAPAAAAPEDDDDMTMANSGPTGECILSWAAGQRHVIQILTKPGAGLAVSAEFFQGSSQDHADSTWTENLTTNAAGQVVFEIPVDKRAECRGVLLTAAATAHFGAYAG